MTPESSQLLHLDALDGPPGNLVHVEPLDDLAVRLSTRTLARSRQGFQQIGRMMCQKIKAGVGDLGFTRSQLGQGFREVYRS